MTAAGAELRATYRLQLTPAFGFDHARELIPYLRDLGISHLYLSPSFEARAGSTHGYDVIDPRRLSVALGGENAFRALAGSAHGAGMGIVLDVVPNHMAADEHNRYWADEGLRKRFFDVDQVTGRHRRFFDIDELAAVRQEDPEVFAQSHELVLGLVRQGLVDGLRIDHPDGLADPAGYLERLRDGGARRVWVEKILHPDERLRDWPVSGTVGYEFLNDVAALFVDPAGEAPLTRLWEEVSGDTRAFGAYAHEAKLQQATGTFRPELERLARTMAARPPAGTAQPAGGPSTPTLAAALASLPVYRTYIDAAAGVIAAQDRRAIVGSGMDPEIAAMLLLERDAPIEFITRFQQTTPAIMAKGVEDTAFYRYGRLLTLNDVGGDPSRFGIDVERFHAANAERATRFPSALLTTQTHDAKRSADVRARIGAIAAVADEWLAVVGRWMERSDGLRCTEGAPDDVERYLLFQTLVGAWPIELERVQTYMEKALREAKRNTNWAAPNDDWERAVRRFVAALLGDQGFVAELEAFVARLRPAGDRAALGQVVLKLTAPGVPDIYQGDELPFRALVDPDNRRPVDWQLRDAMLRRLMGGGRPDANSVKFHVVQALLGLRARRIDCFAGASYEPVDAGPGTCAFVRGGEVATVVAVRDDPGGSIAGLPGGSWRDVLNAEVRSFGPREPVERLVGEHGVAVWERVG